jgi:hypothetical protein
MDHRRAVRLPGPGVPELRRLIQAHGQNHPRVRTEEGFLDAALVAQDDTLAQFSFEFKNFSPSHPCEMFPAAATSNMPGLQVPHLD